MCLELEEETLLWRSGKRYIYNFTVWGGGKMRLAISFQNKVHEDFCWNRRKPVVFCFFFGTRLTKERRHHRRGTCASNSPSLFSTHLHSPVSVDCGLNFTFQTNIHLSTQSSSSEKNNPKIQLKLWENTTLELKQMSTLIYDLWTF